MVPSSDGKNDETTIIAAIVRGINQYSCNLQFVAINQQSCTTPDVNCRDDTAVVDILLTEKITINTCCKALTPLMVIAVGLNHNHWWAEFDRCRKYLKHICTMSPPSCEQIQFDRPVLMSVVTIDMNGACHMAIFFCLRRHVESDFMVSLIWHAEKDLSEAFGVLLNVTAKYQSWVNEYDDNMALTLQYEYLSRNCCKINDKVCHLFIMFQQSIEIIRK